ncbi:hypothetical protein JOQ06_008622 [Pogonophryne albipinna]|uniref:HAT C-terminal dimerisation domain-containing protein n=1 Tax=Pogonophryne albipinna TaxID=1090488 RepID=A0AAD6AJ75_9TELE|nr:hypothetical protein JOQ06_008622 [Pogonophryne albipinna]
MPSPHYIAEKGIPALHTKVREQVQRHLKEATSIALTTDLWSSGVAPMSLLSLTAHWIDSSFTLHNVVLHAKEMLAKWDIDNDKVHVVMRDNAANMKKAFADMGVQSLGCFAHTLQLVVIQGLLAQRSIIDAVANARKLVGHFKHSPKAYSILEDIQKDLHMPTQRLQQDVSVRWNSTQYMMLSLLQQKRPLSVYAADHDLPCMPSANQWALMEKAVVVSSPFEELTRAVSAATASAADVIPAITVLKCHLSREESTDAGIKTMKRTLLEAVTEHFDYAETEPIYSVATLVDPRYKERFFTSPDHQELAKEALIREVEIMERKRKAGSEVSTEEPPRKSPRRGGVGCAAANSSFVSLYDEILEGNVVESRPVSTSAVVTQVEADLAEQTIPRSENPLHYWRAHATQRPALADTAMKFLCAPCTSVDSERLFSAVLNVLDEKRNRLTADKVQVFVFIKKKPALHFEEVSAVD